MCLAVRTIRTDKRVQHMLTVRPHSQVSATPVGTRVLILCPQCTCTELIPHLKPHCSYRLRWQYQLPAAHYHRKCTVHRTHFGYAQQPKENLKLRAMEIKLEIKRCSTYKVTWWYVRVISVALEKL